MAFLGVVIILTLTPGADMALVMRNALAFGRPSLAPTLAGSCSGLAVHITSCVIGLSLVLARSDTAFMMVKIAGAAYLIWLGLQGLISSRRAASSAEGSARVAGAGCVTRARVPAFFQLYRQAFLGNLLNVKIVLFYLSFLPQFAHPGPGFALRALGLAVIQAACGFLWLLSYGLLIARAADRSRDGKPSRVRARFERLSGVALIAFGLRLAFAVH